MYIGVDGGGTKTAFVLIDQEGNLRASHFEKTCSYITVGIDAAQSILEQGIMTILTKSNLTLSDVRFSFFGLPCYGEDQDMKAVLDDLPVSYLPSDRYRCDNDMVCGWAGSLGCGDGINIVAGTGSICYGEHAGETARSGGWGELFGDEGSAYWVAREGLTLFSKMSDGRLEVGPLHHIMKQHLALRNSLDLTGLIHDQWKGQRDKIAALSRIVYEATRAGDEEAKGIFVRAGQELAHTVDATRRQLNYLPDDLVELSYSGGIFESKELILDPFIAGLDANYAIVKPRFTPAIGAALYAAKCDHFVFGKKALVALAQHRIISA